MEVADRRSTQAAPPSRQRALSIIRRFPVTYLPQDLWARVRCRCTNAAQSDGCPEQRAQESLKTSPFPQPTVRASPDISAYEALVSEIAPLTPQQLRLAAHLRSAELLDSRFLFWLRDQERRPGLGAAEQGLLSRLGQELTQMREWTEEQSNRTLLPSLASSLAYSNLRRWQEETGADAPQVVPGVGLEELYRLGEQEERRLRQSLEAGGGGGGTGPRRGVTRSSIEEFTKHNKAFADLAAGAMARVRQRLMGFNDDGPSAATAVLEALLRQMGSAEERATFLPEAFTPPGLQVLPDPAAADGGSGRSAKPSFVVTTPTALMDAARERLAELRNGREDTSGGGSSCGAGVDARQEGAQGGGVGVARSDVRQPVVQSLLSSGEDEVAALEEILELVEEYDRHVFSRKTPLERMGHSPGPW